MTHPAIRRGYPRSHALIVAVMFVAASATSRASAHEGHAALPAKGSQVDRAKGTIVLSPEAHGNLGVATAEATLREPVEKVLAYASLVVPWTQHAMASSRLGGRIAALNVKPGQEVKAGQVLAEIESLELESLQSEFVNAHNDARLSTKVLEQAETLDAEQVIARRDLYESRTKHHENADAETITRNKLLTAGLSDDDVDSLAADSPRKLMSLPVRSPIAGAVIHADLAVGKVVESSEHLFEIVDLSKMWVRIGVLERDIHRIEVGQKVRLKLTAYPDKAFESTVKVKTPYIDPETHLGVVWADLENPAGQEPIFLPGLYGQAEIVISAPKKMLAVPATALFGDQAGRYVLVEEAANSRAFEYRKRDVAVSLLTPEFAYLLPGDVFAGDRVATTGGHELAAYFFPGVLRLSSAGAKNIDLRVEAAKPRAAEKIIELDGNVDLPPEGRATVSTQLPGVLRKIVARRGQAVQAGDVLAEITGLEIQDLQLQLLKAQLRSELLLALLKSRRELSAEQNLAARQLWETESQYRAAVNDRETARRKLQAIGLSEADIRTILSEQRVLDSVPIRAPISGAVVRFDKTLGQSLAAQEPLFEINDLSTVWVEAYVAERAAPHVRLGQRARVRLVAQPDAVFEGVVVRSSRTLGAENRTLSAWIEIKGGGGGRIQRNMLANVALPIRRTAPSLAVPLGAVVRESIRSYVFVQHEDGRFERRLVRTGLADDRFVQVVSGLKPGEMIAVRGAADLQTAYASVR
ncbi:MAG TPA: efflux RND transporter periplasmic adaptor subunit [Pirellulales bacterium]|nr:efflux RND transporter periplasmic adaptor subunit [Pirellulales bacterium]